MESDNMSESLESDKDYSRKKKQVVDEMKPILKNQIAELKSIIAEMESNLGIFKFSQIKCDLSITPPKVTEIEVQNINVLLAHQLYQFSGFYCAKFAKDEHVFHFSCSNGISEKDTHAVQIIEENGKWSLGKWAMPMGIDLKYLEAENPIDTPKNIPNFLKLCKLHLDAYYMRREQYTALKDIVSQTKNCKLQSSVGYRQIILELMGVYNQKTDKYINIIIYLFYNSDDLIPHTIKLESPLENKLNDEDKKYITKSLHCFKELMLQEAFDKMSIPNPFVWTKEEDVDSPIALDDILSTSEDEEGFLRKFSMKRNKSSVSRNRKKVSRNESKKELSTVSNENEPTTSQNNQEELQNEKTLDNVKSVITIDPTVSNLKEHKLKQTKINFQTKSKEPENKNINTTINSNENNISSLKPLVSKIKETRIKNKLVASTPLRQNILDLDKSDKLDISDITVSEYNSNMAKRSALVEGAENNSPTELAQNKNNTKKRKIESSAKSKTRGTKRKKKV